MHALYVVTAPGLERFTADELRALKLGPLDVTPGGIALQGGGPSLWQLNLRLRTASRVLLRLGSFRATTFGELRHNAAMLPWKDILAPGAPVTLRVTCRKSRLHHSGAVAERVAGAIEDALRKPSAVHKAAEDSDEETPQLFVVRIDDDVCTISADTSGALLHRRGYRQATAKAPLRETLAATMLALAGYDGTGPLVDPMCGSGTLLAEAGWMAQGRWAGGMRSFAFPQWPLFRGAARPVLPAPGNMRFPLVGNDRDAGAIRAALSNTQRAGVSATLHQGDALELAPPPGPPGWLVTNPPYGVRVDEGRALEHFHAQLGRHWKEHWRGWKVCILTTPPLARALELPWREQLPLQNGGLRVVLGLAAL